MMNAINLEKYEEMSLLDKLTYPINVKLEEKNEE